MVLKSILHIYEQKCEKTDLNSEKRYKYLEYFKILSIEKLKPFRIVKMLPKFLFERVQYVKLDERLFISKKCKECINLLEFVENTGTHAAAQRKTSSSIVTYEYLTPDKQLLTRDIVINNCCLWQNDFSKLKVVFFNEIDYDLAEERLNDSNFLKKNKFNDQCVKSLKNRFNLLKHGVDNFEDIFTGNIRVINRFTFQFVDLSIKLFEAFEQIVQCESFNRVWPEKKCEQEEFLETLTKVTKMFPVKKNSKFLELELEIEKSAKSINKAIIRLNKRKRELKNRLYRKHRYQQMQRLKNKIENYKDNEINYMNSRKKHMLNFFKILNNVKEENISLFNLKNETDKLASIFKLKMQNLKFFIPYMRKHCPKELKLSEHAAKLLLNKMLTISIGNAQIIFVASILWNVPLESLDCDKSYFDSFQQEFYSKFKFHQNAINNRMKKVDRFGDLTMNKDYTNDENIDDFDEFYDEQSSNVDESPLYSEKITKVLWN